MPAPLFTSNPAEFTRLEGLYIYEQDPPGFVRGVSLGAVGVFGPCTRGPVDSPTLITSEARFLEVFGGRDFGSGGVLINKVWRSLLNKPFGRLYVVRTLAAAAVAASFTEEDTAGGGGAAIIRIDASSRGAWGNQVKFKVTNATNGVSTSFNLTIKYLGATVVYENLSVNAADDNLATVIGDDLANNVVVTKLASGRPLNTASGTGAYLAALDSAGFMNLGTTVASYVSVAGTEGTIAASDYTGTNRSIDQIKEFKGLGMVYSAEDTEALVTTINTAMITAAAASSDRLFLIWSGDHTDTDVQATTYFNTLTDNDRTINCFNSPYTLDTDTGVLIQTPPVEWVASTLSQIDVDINAGEEATKKFTSGISRLTYESLTREQYALLSESGICAYEKDEGFVIVSAITASLTPGREQITRRRSADFLQLSAAGRLKFFVKKKNLPATRRIMGGEIIAFSDTLQKQGRIVESFEVDQESVNTAAQRAQGLEFILWRVRLIGHMLYLVLKTEIGTGVTIEA